ARGAPTASRSSLLSLRRTSMTTGRRVTEGFTAAQLIKAIRDDGGRVYRTTVPGNVFVLTGDVKLAARLQGLGGRPFNPPGYVPDDEMGGYYRARGGSVEYDIGITPIPVEGDETIWEAAG